MSIPAINANHRPERFATYAITHISMEALGELKWYSAT